MYKVGQVLYTVLTEKQVVVPVKVVEQVTIKTLEGEQTNYKFQLPNTKKQKVSQDKFTNLYESIDKVQNYLNENAKNAILKMISDANTLKDNFFGESLEDIDACNIETSNNIINQDDQTIKINLENGQVANIKMDNINNFIDTNNPEVTQKKT
jgi:hypothetical protein